MRKLVCFGQHQDLRAHATVLASSCYHGCLLPQRLLYYVGLLGSTYNFSKRPSAATAVRADV
jgi:hypothetical protein